MQLLPEGRNRDWKPCRVKCSSKELSKNNEGALNPIHPTTCMISRVPGTPRNRLALLSTRHQSLGWDFKVEHWGPWSVPPHVRDVGDTFHGCSTGISSNNSKIIIIIMVESNK
jgi:hypothetical protein